MPSSLSSLLLSFVPRRACPAVRCCCSLLLFSVAAVCCRYQSPTTESPNPPPPSFVTPKRPRFAVKACPVLPCVATMRHVTRVTSKNEKSAAHQESSKPLPGAALLREKSSPRHFPTPIFRSKTRLRRYMPPYIRRGSSGETVPASPPDRASVDHERPRARRENPQR